MEPAVRTETLEPPITLTKIVPAARMLPAHDKLNLIRILAEELEDAREIFSFESVKTYYLPTPYNSFGAAETLAEALSSYREDGN